MYQTLALKYRPKTFTDVVGQKSVTFTLSKMIEKGKIPPSILLSGPRGSGKTSLGRIIGASLNCKSESTPCGVCVSCSSIYSGTSLEVIEVDAASTGLVSDIRSLKERLFYSVGSGRRVVVLDEAQGLSREAASAALKLIEDPPPYTVFILLTTEKERILETIISRSMAFNLTKISVQEVFNRLKEISVIEKIDISDDLLLKIADESDGALRDALIKVEQLSISEIRSLSEYEQIFGVDDFVLDLVEAAKEGFIERVYSISDEQIFIHGEAGLVVKKLVSVFKELMILKSGGSVSYVGESLDRRKTLAKSLDINKIFQAQQIIWNIRSKSRILTSPKALLDLLLCLITECLCSGQFSNSNQDTSLDDLRKIVG